ncbi:MAG TPA: class I SAM-dependent methyltransferase [Elusimicrobiota bacterium]|nr:class I SAM-dependent methyltransferase [Elusimicrobiota bacterium]
MKDDSHKPETLAKVKRILGTRQIDFLFIDADHSYEGVKKDYGLYSPLVAPGGLIAFHDIVPSYLTRYGTETSVGIVEVARFWEELKASLPPGAYEEIIQDPNQDARGIGVLKLQ